MDENVKDQPQEQSAQTVGGAMVPAQRAQIGAMVRAFEGLMPQSIAEAMQLSVHLSKSQALPGSFRGQPESILTVIMAGTELGLTPIRALQSISNIKGNLCLKADLQLALVRRSGMLAYFDEGFELAGRTDANDSLLNRIDPDYRREAEKILALTEPMVEAWKDDAKPYGWCIVHRRGERPVTRVFTWEDADRVKVPDDEGGQGQQGQQKVKKPLSLKHNYVNYPQDMYPRRARGRALAVAFPDVLAGLPSHEALADGQVFDAEVVVRPGDQDADGMLDQIRSQDKDLADLIQRGFDNLGYSDTRRLVTMRRFDGDPQALHLHLRDEYARGKGKDGAAVQTPTVRAAKAGASHPVEPAKPVPVESNAATVTAEAVPDAEPAKPAAPVPPEASQDPGRQVPEGGRKRTRKARDIGTGF